MEDEDSRYVLQPRDRRVIALTTGLLEKAMNAPFMTAAKMVSVAKVLHVLRRLPLRSEEMLLRLDIIGPTRTFEDREIRHSWSVDLDSDCITISSGGYFYRPCTGGDSFSCMRWSAVPGVEAEYSDYLDSLRIVDDAQPFEEEVAALDLMEPGYRLDIDDDENALLDEGAEEEEDENEWCEEDDDEQHVEEAIEASGSQHPSDFAREVAAGGQQDALQKAAETLVTASVGNAACMFGPLLNIFAFLGEVDQKHWDFIVTVAGVFMAASRLTNLAVGDAREERLMEIVADSLDDLDQDVIPAFEDCKRFYEDQYDRLAAAGHDPKFLACDSIGKWIVWNVLGRPPKSRDEIMLVRAAGAMVTSAFFDWWKTEGGRRDK